MKRIFGYGITAIAMMVFVLFALGCPNPMNTVDLADAQKSARTFPGYIGEEGDLVAGRSIKVGTVQVSNTATDIQVTYRLVEGWQMTESHLALALTLAGIPQTKTHNPIPGQFAYKKPHNPPVTEFTYTIPLGTSFTIGDTLFVAAHAEVQKVDSAGLVIPRESAWAAGKDFQGANWATYFNATLTSVVSHNAMLDDLAPSTHVLIPAFDPDITSYSMSVGNSVNSIQFTPVAADAGATIHVNGALVNSGEESDPIPLGVGLQEVDVVVAAQDGTTTRAYTVAVTRADTGLNVIWGTISKVGEGEIGPSSPLYIVLVSGAGFPTMGIFTEGEFPFNYSFSDLPDGWYMVVSFLDKNNNFSIDPGDLMGPQPNHTVAGADVEVDLTLSQFAPGTLTINLAIPQAIGKNAYFIVSYISQGQSNWQYPETWLAFGYFTVGQGGTGSSVALEVSHIGDQVILLENAKAAILQGCYYHVDIFVDVNGVFAYPPGGDVSGIVPYQGAPTGSRNDIVNGDSQWDAWVSY